ncbi:RNA polymerase sigma factor [Lacibacter sediminis]|uniref:Sigma-70 family RNA polymerase sigma factor n=1 Tax=Lacibacter sediminis TaxID=2760713 RepID=A0A7G5XEL5_9BACT|nr:sigma-70 family RNA polymerase sigma factor [Lacibacter sediminis]QNA43918.1 sigma-70 family RNA polymerase sigma factor [Lacibacter sediminis]
MDNDNNLWQGLKQGDKEMFLALYRKYYHTLLFIGLKEMKDAHLVKDIIQQLFLYLWEKRETIQDARDVKSYLITSFLRKLTADWKKSKQSGLLEVVWSSYPEDPQPNPEEKLIRKDEQSHLFQLLRDHINELPNRQKELIILKFYEGLSYQDIVQRTGLSHRTVYNKIHEGLKKLKLGIAQSRQPRSAALISLLNVLASAATIAMAQKY